ncbi:hypothetical protein C8J57DRAFT_1336037 [Mycena rebaudengoi]|nr:hypothetical protein C8J57DRAFT_1336037 [Mycena rebaudengoi]
MTPLKFALSPSTTTTFLSSKCLLAILMSTPHSFPTVAQEAAELVQVGLHAHPESATVLLVPAHSPPQVGHEKIDYDHLLEIKAVANACKELGDTLSSRGNPTGDANHVRDVHRAYARYLLLYPVQNDSDYQKVQTKVLILEEQFAGNLITEPLLAFPLIASL